MVANTPRFGPKLDPDEHMSHMKNFEAEMYSFTDNKRERDRFVNVLHIDTDLDAVRSEMDRLVKFMKRWGYKVVRKCDLDLHTDRDMFLVGIDTDILIIGSDAARDESAYYMLRCVSLGWFGLVPYWDVLWYGTDYNPGSHTAWPKQMGPDSLPLFSGCKFALDGVCLVHAHIRRRYDGLAIRGAYISMIREIEGRINELLGDAWKDGLATKIKKLKKKVADDGHSGPDVEIFFAALDVLRHTRNVGAHLIKGQPKTKIWEEANIGGTLVANFAWLVDIHKRPLWPPITTSQADSHMTGRWESSIAHMVVAWLEEYSCLSTDSQGVQS